MAIQIYRDIAASDGAAAVAELVFYCLANGFTYVAHSNGSARSTSQPLTAADLATVLRNAPQSWICWSRTTSGVTRSFSLQRDATANPNYTLWRFRYTASGALSAGSGTTPDNNANTQAVGNSVSSARVVAPSTGGVADAMKCHILVDDATATFALITRRTPFPSGNNGFFSAVFSDVLVNPTWAANNDPVALGIAADNTNTANVQMVGTIYNNAWYGYGLPGASWAAAALENPGNVAGSTTTDLGGIDVVYQARWVLTTNAAVYGTSRLFELLQPGRTPIVGLDAGATLNRACFWTVVVPNDGVALTS